MFPLCCVNCAVCIEGVWGNGDGRRKEGLFEVSVLEWGTSSLLEFVGQTWQSLFGFFVHLPDCAAYTDCDWAHPLCRGSSPDVILCGWLGSKHQRIKKLWGSWLSHFQFFGHEQALTKSGAWLPFKWCQKYRILSCYHALYTPGMKKRKTKRACERRYHQWSLILSLPLVMSLCDDPVNQQCVYLQSVSLGEIHSCLVIEECWSVLEVLRLGQRGNNVWTPVHWHFDNWMLYFSVFLSCMAKLILLIQCTDILIIECYAFQSFFHAWLNWFYLFWLHVYFINFLLKLIALLLIHEYCGEKNNNAVA